MRVGVLDSDLAQLDLWPSLPGAAPAVLGGARATMDDGREAPLVGPPRPRLVVSRRRVRPAGPPPTPITNARIAVVMLLVSESMFFAGLIGVYLVFRGGSPVWPPPALPRLPLGVTWVNTAVLMASALSMLAAVRAAAAAQRATLLRALGVTVLLGAIFLSVQGAEWVRLVHYGLTISTGTYGSTFYVLIGTHAAHVLGAMLWLGGVALWVTWRELVPKSYDIVEACGIYWCFVCGLWLVLFALVYN